MAFRLASAALILLFSASAQSQDTTRMPSQILLKRLAEAVDGNRHLRTMYVVARYDSLGRVAGVFPERRDAEVEVRRLGRMYDIFGPFTHHPDLSAGGLPLRQGLFWGCIHDGRTSMFDPICPERFFPLESIESVSITLRMRDGTTLVKDLGRTTDAVFLSMPAIDKFVIPYYQGVIGTPAAAAMRADIAAKAATASSRVPPP